MAARIASPMPILLGWPPGKLPERPGFLDGRSGREKRLREGSKRFRTSGIRPGSNPEARDVEKPARTLSQQHPPRRFHFVQLFQPLQQLRRGLLVDAE